MFNGFTEDTVQFFLDIRFHNEVAYMHARHDDYVRLVQQPFYQLISDLSPLMLSIDPDMELRPSRCLSRIHRDTRYSADKSPYRDHHWVAFRPAGLGKDGQPFFWFEFGPDNLSWGAGLWGENREAMNALRLRIVHESDRILKLAKQLGRRGIVTGGASMQRIKIPEDVPGSLHPLYRLKSVYFERTGIDWKWAFDSQLIQRVQQDYMVLKPAYLLLKECVAASAQQAPAVPERIIREDF